MSKTLNTTKNTELSRGFCRKARAIYEAVSYDGQPFAPAQFREPNHDSETEALKQQGRDCGTISRPHCGTLTYLLDRLIKTLCECVL